MGKKRSHGEYHFVNVDKKQILQEIGKDRAIQSLKQMLRIRHFEIRAEVAYQQGKIGGFFHAYAGQEAIQTSCVDLLGQKPWYSTTYRCHALALLLGVTPKEAMAELYGRATGNAFGRGGSMHLYSDRLLGGFGIVGGHVPIAIGAAFSLKYLKQGSLSICFLGDGAIVQGAVHESLNLASLWDLPCMIVVENNKWGMGTAVERAVCMQPIAEKLAPAYEIPGYTIDGSDYLASYGAFKIITDEIQKTGRPALVEAITQRFKGHSVSDPGLYRSKEELQTVMATKDPITRFKEDLKEAKWLTDAEYDQFDEQEKELIVAAMKFADESPWPDITCLEEGVYASEIR